MIIVRRPIIASSAAPTSPTVFVFAHAVFFRTPNLPTKIA